jgi:hypothetical protein
MTLLNHPASWHRALLSTLFHGVGGRDLWNIMTHYIGVGNEREEKLRYHYSKLRMIVTERT